MISGSEGAVIANLLAAGNHYVDATIAFNGGGRWFIDDVLHSITSEYKDSEEAKVSIESFKGFSQHILSNEPFDLEMMLALRKSGKRNIEYLFYENLDHTFNDSKGQKKPGKVIIDMNALLKVVLSGPND